MQGLMEEGIGKGRAGGPADDNRNDILLNSTYIMVSFEAASAFGIPAAFWMDIGIYWTISPG
jgi:hypothetical protein